MEKELITVNIILTFAVVVLITLSLLTSEFDRGELKKQNNIIMLQNELIIAQQDETNAYLSTEVCYFFNDTDEDFRNCLLDNQD